MARVDGTVTVRQIPRREKKELSVVAERTMMYDENCQGSGNEMINEEMCRLQRIGRAVVAVNSRCSRWHIARSKAGRVMSSCILLLAV